MEWIEKIRYIFDIKKSFNIRCGDDPKQLKNLTIMSYSIENGVCRLNYRYLKYNTISLTFFTNDDIWHDLISDKYLDELFSIINSLYRKKKIKNILKNYEIDKSNI